MVQLSTLSMNSTFEWLDDNFEWIFHQIRVGNTKFKEIEFDFEPLDQQTMKTCVIDEHWEHEAMVDDNCYLAP